MNEQALSALARTGKANDRRNTLIHHAITRITYNLDPDAHKILFVKKDHRLREKPIETILKGAEFKALTKELRLTARALDGVKALYRLSLARRKSSPEMPDAQAILPQES